MKHVITLATVATLTLATSVHAESQLSAELRKVQSGYEAAVHSALDPIKQQHAIRLQELLKRTQATGDKQAFVDTLVELRKLGPAAIQYSAKTIFEFPTSNEVSAEQVLRNHLNLSDPFISSFTQLRNTSLFELTVTASDPQFAAGRANDLVAALQQSVEARKAFPPIKIWDYAIPPEKPIATK